MSDEQSNQAQLPPTNAIQVSSLRQFDSWFEYPVRVHPHHTDYAGIVWHGTYLTWMEEARVECLRSIGIEFADLVALGCDLPVVELSIRYHRSVQLGMAVVVKARMIDVTGVRINWDYAIVSTDGQQLFVTAKVTLVALDRDRGKSCVSYPATSRMPWQRFLLYTITNRGLGMENPRGFTLLIFVESNLSHTLPANTKRATQLKWCFYV